MSRRRPTSTSFMQNAFLSTTGYDRAESPQPDSTSRPSTTKRPADKDGTEDDQVVPEAPRHLSPSLAAISKRARIPTAINNSVDEVDDSGATSGAQLTSPRRLLPPASTSVAEAPNPSSASPWRGQGEGSRFHHQLLEAIGETRRTVVPRRRDEGEEDEDVENFDVYLD